MDAAALINEHTKMVQQGLLSVSAEQRKNLTNTLLGFYFLLPGFEQTLRDYLKINIDKQNLINDIKNDRLEKYRSAIEKCHATFDEYADDFQEVDRIDILIIEAFSNAISDLKNAANTLGLFIGIIDILDYYEAFSDNPEYWNNLLENEISYQRELLAGLKTNENLNSLGYPERYETVLFDTL
ncbi:hypothetical protein [Flavobacterium kingsejongi]|nr:hypothetical protein [Flavobacterium kingsejongi]